MIFCHHDELSTYLPPKPGVLFSGWFCLMLVQVVFAVSITSAAAAAAAAGAILIELGNESWGGGGSS